MWTAIGQFLEAWYAQVGCDYRTIVVEMPTALHPGRVLLTLAVGEWKLQESASFDMIHADSRPANTARLMAQRMKREIKAMAGGV